MQKYGKLTVPARDDLLSAKAKSERLSSAHRAIENALVLASQL
jgi:hypothetical protein